MPTQQRITQYLVPNSNNDNDEVEVDPRPRQPEVGVVLIEMEKMCQQMVVEFKKSTDTAMDGMKTMLECNTDKVMEIRSEINERLLRAEKTIIETMEAVIKLRAEIDLSNQTQGQAHGGVGEVGRAQGEEHHQALPVVVSSEVLTSMVNNHQRVEDNYWRSSLMITIGSGEFGDYRSWLHKLRTCGLHFMLEGVRSHFITGRGNLRLTFATEFEMRKILIRGRKYCKEKGIRNLHIEFLIPPRHVNVKKQMMRYGRQMKINQRITSYDVIIRGGLPVLRTFHHSDGVKYWTLGDLQQQDTIARQSPIGDATDAEMLDNDQIIHTDERGLPSIANQEENRLNDYLFEYFYN